MKSSYQSWSFSYLSGSFGRKKSKKSNNMSMDNIKISQKTKNKGCLSIEKKLICIEKENQFTNKEWLILFD